MDLLQLSEKLKLNERAEAMKTVADELLKLCGDIQWQSQELHRQASALELAALRIK